MQKSDIFIIILFSISGAAPILLTIWNLVKLKRKKSSLRFEIIAFVVGMLLMAFDYALLEPVYYKVAINFEMGPVLHEAFNRYHLTTLVVLWLLGILSYFVLKFYKKDFAPLIEAILLAGLYIGSIVSVLAAVQLSAVYRADFAAVLLVSFMYLFFFNYFVLVINLLISIAKNKAAAQKNISYKNAFLNTCSQFLLKGSNRFIGAVLLMLPVLAVLVLILTLFGQEPDSIIKAFSQTSDWLLSTKISPPAIESGGHYLCTVSLRGHKKLVKPIRYGIRNGNKIVVNRQLCIANAFEQLIMEKAPVFHRSIRNFYDTYGYPVSKLIRKAWVADVIYLLMKPLEWVFLFVLYTFDKKPENRIARQYLPEIR